MDIRWTGNLNLSSISLLLFSIFMFKSLTPFYFSSDDYVWNHHLNIFLLSFLRFFSFFFFSFHVRFSFIGSSHFVVCTSYIERNRNAPLISTNNSTLKWMRARRPRIISIKRKKKDWKRRKLCSVWESFSYRFVSFSFCFV